MVPTQEQIHSWILDAGEPDMNAVSLIVTRASAESGRLASGSKNDRFISFLKTHSETFYEFVHQNEHGIEAGVLAATVVIEVCKKQHLSVEEAHMLTLAVLHAILQFGSKP